jgi:hypothetical protein
MSTAESAEEDRNPPYEEEKSRRKVEKYRYEYTKIKQDSYVEK